MQATSLHAYHTEIKPTLGERQRAVYGVLSQALNLTNSEIAGRLGASINTITPRVFELRAKGMVAEDTKRPCRVTGRMAIAWKIINKETLF